MSQIVDDWSYHLAREAKRTMLTLMSSSEAETTRHLPTHESLFRPPRSHNVPVTKKSVTCEVLSRIANQEYEDWRTVDSYISHDFDMQRQLYHWIEDISVDDLARLISCTPSGVRSSVYFDEEEGDDDDDDLLTTTQPPYAFLFTAWQRITMINWCCTPFTTTSTVEIDMNRAFHLNGKRQRKMPIRAQYSMLQGSFPDVGIVDMPTATGKTAWSCCVAFMAVCTERFDSLVTTYRSANMGKVLKGSASVVVPRLVLIATAASTYVHFCDTLIGLFPEFARLDKQSTCILWTGVKKSHSLSIASAKDASEIIFWVVPMCKLNVVLRATPSVAVAMFIADEFTVDTPKERSRTSKSPMIKQLIMQATPQALVDATKGYSSLLREYFGGPLIPPCEIMRVVEQGQMTKAQLACEQLCILDLVTLTAYRDLIRNDLCSLMPNGLLIYFVKSRRFSVSAHVLSSEQLEFVPLCLSDVLIKQIRPYIRTHDDARQQNLDEFEKDIRAATRPADVVRAIVALATKYDLVQNATVQRLVARIHEYVVACPICLSEAGSMHMFGCCGYCVCISCRTQCTSRCPFCRQLQPHVVNALIGEVAQGQAQEEEVHLNFPARPARVDIDNNSNFEACLNASVVTQRSQSYNVTMTLHSLFSHGYKRVLMLLESEEYSHRLDFHSVVVQQLAQATGAEVHRIDTLLSGDGHFFAGLKTRLDDRTTQPMVLVCYGMDTRVLIGTNFDFIDSMVVVGDIPPHMLTQALGRTLRPRASRDNSKPMVMIKLVL
jgi:hypothetical protein